MNVKDFNSLDFKSLTKLPGIGKGTANRIVLYRDKYQFNSAKDLLKIKGIGRNTLIKLGIEPPEKKRKVSRNDRLQELIQYVSGFSLSQKTPFNELPHNSKIAFYEDLVKDTCHRPDLVRASTGCNTCPYVLVCKCHLRNFVSDRNKRNSSPTKSVQRELYDNINNYYHYKTSSGEVNYSKLNMPEYD
jgi:hypothetical protein